MSAHKCEGRVYQGPGLGFKACCKNAAYEHEGKWFCKAHHPPTIKEKSAAKTAIMRAEWAKGAAESKAKATALAEQKRRADCYPDLLAALESLLANLTEGDFISLTRIDVARAAIAKANGEKP